MMGTCSVCDREMQLREDRTIGFHTSERYRTCPGSMKPANSIRTSGMTELEQVLFDASFSHQRIPDDFIGNRCSGCDHLIGTSDGPNSPRHVEHVAKIQAAAVIRMITKDLPDE